MTSTPAGSAPELLNDEAICPRCQIAQKWHTRVARHDHGYLYECPENPLLGALRLLADATARAEAAEKLADIYGRGIAEWRPIVERAERLEQERDEAIQGELYT